MPKLQVEINLDLTDPNNNYLRPIFNKLKSKKYLPLSKAIISGTIEMRKPPNWNWSFKVSYIDLHYRSKHGGEKHEKKKK